MMLEVGLLVELPVIVATEETPDEVLEDVLTVKDDEELVPVEELAVEDEDEDELVVPVVACGPLAYGVVQTIGAEGEPYLHQSPRLRDGQCAQPQWQHQTRTRACHRLHF
ncbi:hypothetical protein DOTSEDRAFT_40486 [Dothistroma septosporum NZE10]|uniref:Uncharacterized protein n=1 Tax=Dothistroma septosporum (strain NZE10 / CBS 128990) TaxID=675120 RepID=N1Q0D9_DOTSN|nr:hypothetical protein DOTSEDRAFT_40486 [Dothistroma septosporum NZE10]